MRDTRSPRRALGGRFRGLSWPPHQVTLSFLCLRFLLSDLPSIVFANSSNGQMRGSNSHPDE
jgi:hypothetical protein